MMAIFGPFIVVLLVAGLVGVSVREIWKGHKSGGCGSCSGSCGGSCAGCSQGCGSCAHQVPGHSQREE